MVFLDYASTNPYTKFPCSKYGPFLNPNANYAHKEKQLLHDCEERIKVAIGAKSGKVLFGGTSSQLVENLFFKLMDRAYLSIGSIYEHDATFRFADQWGNVESLKHTIKTYNGDKQLIVMLQGTNNITGQIMPIVEIGKLCREHGAYFICDLTAHISHTAIPDNIDEWCSCCFFGGHKIGTELGIGCMWLSPDFNDFLNDMTLHGTPNLAGALAICEATEDAIKDFEHKVNDASSLYCHLLNQLDLYEIKYENITYNGTYTPFINAIRLIGIDAFALQQFLASKDIYIGIGQSSCAANEDFRQLCNGYNLKPEEAREIIRISFGEYSTYEDIDKFIEGVKEFKEEYL